MMESQEPFIHSHQSFIYDPYHDETFSLFISCSKGLEYLLKDELEKLGFSVTKVSPQGIYGPADLKMIYHLALWSRLASRIHLILSRHPAESREEIYQASYQFPWDALFNADQTLAIEFHGSSTHIRNSLFGAQIIKDAIVDYFQETHGKRPSIDRKFAAIKLHAHLKESMLTIALDFCGYSLHQRGYRKEQGAAPLKENIAAALLIRAKWPELMNEDLSLLDPCCGSGTLVIEAALMAAKIAPGLLRTDQAFHNFKFHQEKLWLQCKQEAASAQIHPKLKLYGSDQSGSMILKAKTNSILAGVEDYLEFDNIELKSCRPKTKKGLFISNFPYGERLSDTENLVALYRSCGILLHEYFKNWEAAIFTYDEYLAKSISLRAHKRYIFFNGPLQCKLYCFKIDENNYLKTDEAPIKKEPIELISDTPQKIVLINRLQKNYRHLKKWAQRNQYDAYRVYDADLAEYNYAIDLYKDYAVLQEYMAPKTIELERAEKHSAELIDAVKIALKIDPERIIIKARKPQKGSNQYQKLDQSQHRLIIQEGSAQFKVNLYDYLDTGIFLDTRLLRLKFGLLPPGTQFLNCFSYTASASVHAALAGALTTSIDLSKTYISWSKENFVLNKINLSNHQFIQTDYFSWLKENHQKFDIIYLDPPSFSNSKRMNGTLDIQRDHLDLIKETMKHLKPNGTLFFISNLRGFRLSKDLHNDFHIIEGNNATIDIDFKRNQKIHHSFTIKFHPSV